MTIDVKSPLPGLIESVSAFFVEQGITAIVKGGWRARARQDNQGPGRANRVVFMPGDINGRGGRLIPPQQPGRRDVMSTSPSTRLGSVRALCDWDRVLTVSVWSYDGDKRTDDFAQVVAAERLLEQVVQAVHFYAYANAIWGDVTHTVPGETAFGHELLVGLSFRHPIFSVPAEAVSPTPTPVLTQSLVEE